MHHHHSHHLSKIHIPTNIAQACIFFLLLKKGILCSHQQLQSGWTKHHQHQRHPSCQLCHHITVLFLLLHPHRQAVALHLVPRCTLPQKRVPFLRPLFKHPHTHQLTPMSRSSRARHKHKSTQPSHLRCHHLLLLLLPLLSHSPPSWPTANSAPLLSPINMTLLLIATAISANNSLSLSKSQHVLVSNSPFSLLFVSYPKVDLPWHSSHLFSFLWGGGATRVIKNGTKEEAESFWRHSNTTTQMDQTESTSSNTDHFILASPPNKKRKTLWIAAWRLLTADVELV